MSAPSLVPARDIESVLEITDGIEAVVLDQFGVLHDGARPYPGAAEAIEALRARGLRIAVLSNSGKRAALNAERIRRIGLPLADEDVVMTSGEALRTDIASGRVPARRLHAVCGDPDDADRWAEGLEVTFAPIEKAEALLLMGVPDGIEPGDYEPLLAEALARGLPAICTNPDRASPRGGRTVPSVGALAARYEAMGGAVRWYGKPHAPVFEALGETLGDPEPHRILMVGDSPAHDVRGARALGWRTLLVRDGLHAGRFAAVPDIDAALDALLDGEAERPDHTIASLRA